MARPTSGSLLQCLRDNDIEVITGADYPAYLEASQVSGWWRCDPAAAVLQRPPLAMPPTSPVRM